MPIHKHCLLKVFFVVVDKITTNFKFLFLFSKLWKTVIFVMILRTSFDVFPNYVSLWFKIRPLQCDSDTRLFWYGIWRYRSTWFDIPILKATPYWEILESTSWNEIAKSYAKLGAVIVYISLIEYFDFKLVYFGSLSRSNFGVCPDSMVKLFQFWVFVYTFFWQAYDFADLSVEQDRRVDFVNTGIRGNLDDNGPWNGSNCPLF